MPRALQPQAQVRLEDLSGRDALAAGLDGGEMARGPGRRRPEGADGHRFVPDTVGQARAQTLKALAEHRVTLLTPKRLEPPAAGRVEVQQMVVEGQREEGKRGRPRGRGRDWLEPGAETVAEEAEPAATDGTARRIGRTAHRASRAAFAGRHDGLPVQQLEWVFVRPGHHDGLRPHQRPTACPRARKRKRMSVAPHQQGPLGRRHLSFEGDPDQSGFGGNHSRVRAEPRRYSGQEGSPVVAPRITLSDSRAHFRRVGEMSIPSWSMTQSASNLSTSSTVSPISSSDVIDAAACEIAQPWPWNRSSAIRPSSTTTCTPSSSPQRGLWSWNSRSCGSSVPKFRGFL